MGRRPNITRSVPVHVTIPEDLHARLALYLYSSIEGKIPKNAWSEFFTQRVAEFFSRGPSQETPNA